MTVAETYSARETGRGSPGNDARLAEPRSFGTPPRMNLPLGQHRASLFADRVRARPAISPQLSFMIGQTAVGLGIWGTLFPNSVKKTLGIQASTPTVQALFGAREMVSGVTLMSDPTKSGMLWGRVAGDIFDIAVLTSLSKPQNPKSGTAKAALGFVLAVTALDLFTAVRMSTVKRTCD
ncbi:hypothetical protein [Phenylobacterium sp.]|uniref:hypothetical protein n=1 Tax=Phenylobacterium sp. TaxID=1871053 RepID=UPI0035B00BE3